MNCRICGRQDARIRLCELKTARITKRAHVDCNGHSEYRSLTVAEIDFAQDCEAYTPNAQAHQTPERSVGGMVPPVVGNSGSEEVR